MTRKLRSAAALLLFLLALPLAILPVFAEDPPSVPAAPPRAEGEGPFNRLILRGVTVIDGTGAPPMGPVDIVIEKNRITDVVPVGSPGVAIDPESRPKAGRGTGRWTSAACTPCPASSTCTATSAAWSRAPRPSTSSSSGWGTASPPSATRAAATASSGRLDHKAKSASNEITAPRIEAYVFFGMGREEPFLTPDEARKWVAEIGGKGADGFKFFGYRPDIMKAAIEEAKKRGLRSAAHHAQMSVSRVNVLDLGALGPDHDGALVRAARGAVRRPHPPGLPARLQLQRRVAPLRRGRPPLEAGRAPGLRDAGTR